MKPLNDQEWKEFQERVKKKDQIKKEEEERRRKIFLEEFLDQQSMRGLIICIPLIIGIFVVIFIWTYFSIIGI